MNKVAEGMSEAPKDFPQQLNPRFADILRRGEMFLTAVSRSRGTPEKCKQLYRLDRWTRSSRLREQRQAEGVYTSLYGPLYGHEDTLREYAGLSDADPFYAVCEHAPYLGKVIYWNEVSCIHPIYLVAGEWRARWLRRYVNKVYFSIGPYIAYSAPLLSPEDTEAEKKRLGRNILVFPSHSTEYLRVRFQREHLCRRLEDFRREFDTVRVCLGFQDLIHGEDEPYRERGFEVVSAGYKWDPLFLPRLRSLIELADLAVSNSLGTHIGYSVVLDRPHWVFRIPCEIEESRNLTDARRSELREWFALGYEEIERHFEKLRYSISPHQREIVRTHFGSDQVRTSGEIREILDLAEELTRKKAVFRGWGLHPDRSEDSVRFLIGGAGYEDLEHAHFSAARPDLCKHLCNEERGSKCAWKAALRSRAAGLLRYCCGLCLAARGNYEEAVREYYFSWRSGFQPIRLFRRLELSLSKTERFFYPAESSRIRWFSRALKDEGLRHELPDGDDEHEWKKIQDWVEWLATASLRLPPWMPDFLYKNSAYRQISELVCAWTQLAFESGKREVTALGHLLSNKNWSLLPRRTRKIFARHYYNSEIEGARGKGYRNCLARLFRLRGFLALRRGDFEEESIEYHLAIAFRAEVRIDDALAALKRQLARLPDHGAALKLRGEIDSALSRNGTKKGQPMMVVAV